MMLSSLGFDPYEVLGVQKDSDLTEIKTAHRKLALIWHPDKIKDKSQLPGAQDKFQQVQKAYELLSDVTRRTQYDQQVRLAELREEAEAAGFSAYATAPKTASREYRDGRIYEERAPADPGYADDDLRFSDEQRPSSWKYDYRKRRTDEKKKTRAPPTTSERIPKDTAREASKVSRQDRAKHRTKERRREVSDKYGRTLNVDSDSEAFDSDDSYYRGSKHVPEARRSRATSSRKVKNESSHKADSGSYHEEDYTNTREKGNFWQSSAEDYISRTRGDEKLPRGSRSPRSPRSYDEYDPTDPTERETPRFSSRSHVRTDSTRDISPLRDRRSSYDHPRSHPKSHDRKIPTLSSFHSAPVGGLKSPSFSRPLQPTTLPSRTRQDTLNRSESAPVAESPRTKLRQTERYDSGYSSPDPGTPCTDGARKIRYTYKILEETHGFTEEPEPLFVEREPELLHRCHRSFSPDHPSVSTRAGSKITERRVYETLRPSASRTASRTLFGEVDVARPYKDDVKFRETRRDHVIYRDPFPPSHYERHHPPITVRRQPAY